jgi:DNA primase small subunit
LKSLAFIQNMFREYYVKDFTPNQNIPAIEKREFGFASFEGWMLRHKTFSNTDELASFLRDSVPLHAYVSGAYYEDPEAEMEKKGWLGADLIFEIDADHIPTPCNKIHDEWTCNKCGFSGKGIVPEKCPACGGEKFDDRTWICEVCLASAKLETIKLLDMLTRDFGFHEKEMRTFFSGHRGYHIHVESETVKALDSIARKEIVDYVSGIGLETALHGLDENDLRNLSVNDSGWRGRTAKGMHSFILNAGQDDYKNIGLERPSATSIMKAITNNKDAILKSLSGLQPWRTIKGIGPETWKRIIEHSAKQQTANVDTVVTTDIHRLIRLAGSLHGKTGLKKVEFPAAAIDSFDPFKSAIAFKAGTTTVSVSNAPEFRLGDETFGPYQNQKADLPTAAAMLLICKKRAEVAE